MGALGETFDWPVPITMMLSLAAGITVSISGNKLLFKNADGIEIGSKTLSDDDLKIVEQTIEGENYSNLTEVVSAKEAEVYLHFLESGSTEGMTESELKAVQKIEELIKSNKIDYDGILKIRNETVKSDVEVVRKTTEDSVEDVGKNAAEDAGKVVETSYGKSTLNSLKNTENFTDSAIEHIFEGQVNARGKAVGYHYEGIEGTSGNVIPGTESSVNNIGVYKAQVEVNGIPKTANGGFSTFYSKNLSPQQVVDAINEAYSNCELKLGTRNTYQGVANNGMKIDMFLDQSGKIISAFPEG